MKIISPKVPTDTWLELFDLDGVDATFSYIIENVSNVGIRLALEGEDLTEVKDCILIHPNEEFYLPPTLTTAKIITEGSLKGYISIRRADSTDIRASLRKITGLSDPRVLTQGLTQVEAASIEGRTFYTLLDVTIPTGSTVWYNIQTPTDKLLAVYLKEITPFYTGFEAQLYRNSTGMTNSTAVPLKRMNKNYTTTTATMNLLTAAPTTIGTLEDILLLVPVSGSNPSQRSTSSPSSSSGYMIFDEGDTLQISLINTSGNANRVIFKLYWLEAGATVLETT